MKDLRKEKEKKINESLNELDTKGFTWDRANEYQRLQTEWWKECDRIDKYDNNIKFSNNRT